MAEWKPAHETIIRLIEVSSVHDIRNVGRFINETKISANHDDIAKSWKTTWGSFSMLGLLGADNTGVVDGLLKQKREAEEKASAERARVAGKVTALTESVDALAQVVHPAPPAEIDVPTWPGITHHASEDVDDSEDDSRSFGTHIKEAIKVIKGS